MRIRSPSPSSGATDAAPAPVGRAAERERYAETNMSESHARAQAKATAQAIIGAADAALAAGRIPEAEWQRRVTDALARAYLGEDDPRWQSGFDGDADLWRQARSLVLDAVPRDGTFLDVGCATGHLMECLAGWAAERGVTLTLSGLELNPALATAARRRLPEWADRIYTGNVSGWRPPQRFTYVRTGLEYVAPEQRPVLIARLLREAVAPGGRLLVGPVSEGDIPATTAAFVAAGVRTPRVVSAADRNGTVRAVVWASPEQHDGAAA
jgi:hypothetical protein